MLLAETSLEVGAWWASASVVVAGLGGWFLAVMRERHKQKQEMVVHKDEQAARTESVAIGVLQGQITDLREWYDKQIAELRSVIERQDTKLDTMNADLIALTKSEAECRAQAAATQSQLAFLQREVQTLRGACDGDHLANHVDKVAGESGINQQ